MRPTNDQVRAALFNILGDIQGQSVLDAYAGSGAVGFEALSRGAALCDAIEANRAAAKVIQANAAALGVAEEYQLTVAKVEDWLSWPSNRPAPHYNLIMADPPYAHLDATVLDQLGEFLAPGGLLVVSHAAKIESPALHNLRLVDQRRYGDSALSFYRRN